MPSWKETGFELLARVRGALALVTIGVAPAAASAQQPTAAAMSLVFDAVTVVDVEHGKLLPEQQVVITGNRIRAVGRAGEVRLPQSAQVVEARGKYLIPGLWDMYVNVDQGVDEAYPRFIVNGIGSACRSSWLRRKEKFSESW